MVSRGLFYFVTAILLCLGILLVAYQKVTFEVPFIPGEQKPYRYSGKSTPLVKRQQMIPTLQQLINFATWKTELCPSTRIEVVP